MDAQKTYKLALQAQTLSIKTKITVQNEEPFMHQSESVYKYISVATTITSTLEKQTSSG
jgi:hypothetical protein